jgi:hypothetical protein
MNNLILIKNEYWSYTKDSAPRTFHIIDPDGKPAAYLQIYDAHKNLFLLHNDLRLHPDSYDFADSISQDYRDGLITAKNLLIEHCFAS